MTDDAPPGGVVVTSAHGPRSPGARPVRASGQAWADAGTLRPREARA